MINLDLLLDDPRFAPYRGWHKYEGENMPAVQQDREEFTELLELIAQRELRTGLQIGLGHSGGSHWFFQHILSRIVTIDGNNGYIARYSNAFGGEFICGDSHSLDVIEQARKISPFDFVFIDGDHTRPAVENDFWNYLPMVRSGGIIALHDAVVVSPMHQVKNFIDDLRHKFDFNIIGTCIGIGWMEKTC